MSVKSEGLTPIPKSPQLHQKKTLDLLLLKKKTRYRGLNTAKYSNKVAKLATLHFSAEVWRSDVHVKC